MKISFIAFILIGVACAPKQGAESALDKVAYQLQVDTWHQQRIDELKSEKGWLNVAGLFWLEEGINTFGSSEKNSIVFPKGKIAERAGFILLKQGVVTLEASPESGITSGGKPVTSMVIFHPDSARGTVLDHDPLQWFVIRRGPKFAVRLRDFKNENLSTFSGIERFPVDPAWQVVGKLIKADSGKTIDITNVVGQTTATPTPGTFVFHVDDKEYRLAVINEGKDKLFIIVGDQTNTKETYGAGRYLYVNLPDKNGNAILDFNKLENPPCAFTEFATCPLPPKQNILPIRITAGEKNYIHHKPI